MLKELLTDRAITDDDLEQDDVAMVPVACARPSSKRGGVANSRPAKAVYSKPKMTKNSRHRRRKPRLGLYALETEKNDWTQKMSTAVAQK